MNIARLFLLFACSLMTSLTWASPAKEHQKTCAALLNAPLSLRQQVLPMEADLQSKQGESEKTAKQIAASKKQIESIESEMSWSERNLWRWLAKIFGADVQKIDDLKTREERKAALIETHDLQKSEAQEADEEIFRVVDEYLQKNDALFNQLRYLQKDLNHLVCMGTQCLTTIEEAIDQTSSASTMETLDMVTDNKGISLMSSWSTSDAKGKAEEAMTQSKRYLEAVSQLKNNIQQKINQINTVDDTVDLVIDLIFDPGFDFLSIMNMFALNKMGDQLEELQSQINAVHQHFVTEHDQLKSDLDDTVCKLRQLCQSSAPADLQPRP